MSLDGWEPSPQARLLAARPEERGALLDDLASAAAAGDPGAVETLVWAVHRFGLALPAIRRYLLRPVDIDAAEQRTLVAVTYRIRSFRGDARFTTWLHRVAVNEAKQVVRSEARHQDRAAPLPEEAAGPAPHRISSLIADRAVVQQEIDRLPARLRSALVLREHEDLTYEEIAQVLAVPVGTAKTWTRRARALLARRLAEQLGAGGAGRP